MKKYIDLCNRLWKPLKKWLDKLVRRRDNDDPFDHPFAVL